MNKICNFWESNLVLTLYQPETLPPCQMVLTVVSVLFIALFSYVNLTVGRNFNFKPDLTLIQATPQPCITLESVRLLEKTQEMLGIEPGSYCLAARNFTTLLTVASVYLIALFSYVNLTVGRNFNFKN